MKTCVLKSITERLEVLFDIYTCIYFSWRMSSQPLVKYAVINLCLQSHMVPRIYSKMIRNTSSLVQVGISSALEHLGSVIKPTKNSA